MQKEKPTKVYTGKASSGTDKKTYSSKGTKKPKQNPFENIVKEIKKTVAKAMAGSVQHIAILVCGVLLCVAVVGGAIFGISQIGGTENKPEVNYNEIEIDPEADNNYNKDETAIDKDKLSATILPETEDAGQEYIDNTLFIGDSNTVRSLMYEVTGTTWNNVVGAVSMGIQHVVSAPEKVVNFAGMEAVDIVTAVRMIQPQRIILTYGTNNAVWDTDSFITEYKKAVNAIYDAYPYCDIIINAIPPVDKLRDYPNITMQQIDKFNLALAEMCDEEGWKFLDSSEALKDDTTGFAKTDYTIGDGIHLSQKGFDALFSYIRTHAYETEDRRPKLSYCPKRNEQEMPIIGEDPIAIRGRLTVKFVSSDYEYGSIDGEVEQTVKYTKTSDAVIATPKTSNGGIFLGWECEYDGISDKKSNEITFTAPQLSEEITEVVVTAKFGKADIDISKTSVNLENGGTTTLSASIDSGFTGDKTIKWTSSNEKVATVDSNGKVKAVGAGTTKITASAVGGKLQASCTVTVTTTLKEIKIKAPDDVTTVKAGGKALEFKVVAVPEDATVGNVQWSSSDETIAMVDATTGIVKPLKAGKVTITASAKNGNLKATYELTVEDESSSSSSSSSGSSSSSNSASSSGSSSSSNSASSSSSSSSSNSASSSGSSSSSSSSSETPKCNHDALAEGESCTICNNYTKPVAPKCNHEALAEGESCTVCNNYIKPVTPKCAHDTLAEGASCTVCNAYTKPCATCGGSGHTASTQHCADCGTAGHADKSDSKCSKYEAPVSSATTASSEETVISE